MVLFIVTLGGGDFSRREPLFSLWSLLSMAEEQLSETETHPAQLSTCLTHPTWQSEDGKGWGANIHAWWWAQGSLTATSQSSLQQSAARLGRNALWCALLTHQWSSWGRMCSVSISALLQECSSNSQPWQEQAIATPLQWRQSLKCIRAPQELCLSVKNSSIPILSQPACLHRR